MATVNATLDGAVNPLTRQQCEYTHLTRLLNKKGVEAGRGEGSTTFLGLWSHLFHDGNKLILWEQVGHLRQRDTGS
jgi:hypothetical protein